jgi:hypothetical protein
MTHLERLAGRVAGDPAFVAYALALYAESEQLGDEALADRLGCGAGTLPLLRLCLAPGAGPGEFERDVRQIARRFGVSEEKLAAAIRRGLVLAKFRSAGVRAEGTILAARENEECGEEP